ncbi:MAG: hypothetical protein COB51_04760 [Moraxellaceae bacterium]|nr:MAG: hypothetical protein COB51_04760 [Moraxellaceae bacterium]
MKISSGLFFHRARGVSDLLDRSAIGLLMALIIPLILSCSDSSNVKIIKNHLAYLDETSGGKHFYIDDFEYNITQQVFTPRLIGRALVIAEEAMPPLSKLQIRYNILLSEDQHKINGFIEVLLINGEGLMELDVLLPIHDAKQIEVSFSPLTWYGVERATLSTERSSSAAVNEK